MTIKDRIKILIKYFCNGKKSNFAQMIGVTSQIIILDKYERNR